jgi:anti-anti-sigma factor
MVSSTVSERQLTIGVEGRFDFRIYDSFRNAYEDIGEPIEKYIIDLAAAEYMDSSALGMLLLLREFAGGDDANIQLSSPNAEIRNVLDIANFGKLFTIN